MFELPGNKKLSLGFGQYALLQKKNLEMQFLATILPCQIQQYYPTCNLQNSL